MDNIFYVWVYLVAGKQVFEFSKCCKPKRTDSTVS